MPKCKITVLKRMAHQDLADEYCEPGAVLPCPRFADGQEFLLRFDSLPDESFCDWAWNDIYKSVVSLMNGGSYPKAKDKNTLIACCGDGIRPVVFKLERIAD